MNLTTHIARRYLFAKQSTQVITIISRIAMGGIGIGAFALIVVLSAFNGLENLVASLYTNFDPDIKITATNSKFFEQDSTLLREIQTFEDVSEAAYTLEEIGMVKYRDKQMFAKIKGVPERFLQLAGVDSNMYEGQAILQNKDAHFAILGYGIAYELDFYLTHLNRPLVFYAARNDVKTFQNPQNAFRTKSLNPAGVFAINPDVDQEYVLVPLDFAQDILNQKNKAAQLEIWTKPNADIDALSKKIEAKLGQAFTVKTRFQLNEIIYKTNQSEKWITFFILFFILLIATFNLIGSVTLLMMEKKKDIQILRALGAPLKLVQEIFLKKGVFLALLGGSIGVLLGVVLVVLQKEIGIIPLQGSIVEYYPVALEGGDILVVSLSVLFLSSLGSFLPVSILLSRYYNSASEL